MKTKLIALLASCMLMATAATAMAVPVPVGATTFHWTNYENHLSTTATSPQTLSGVFSLDTISPKGGSPTWAQGNGGQYLYGYFDSLLTTSAVGEKVGSQTTFSGGKLYVFETTSVFDLTKTATIFSDLAAAGTLWLSADFVAGGDFTQPASTLVATITGGGNSGTTPNYPAIKGRGTSLLDVTGGTMFSTFNTNSFTRFDGSGQFADLSMENTFAIINNGTSPLVNTYKGWDVVSSDPIDAVATPEPGTFALLGAGLIGLGFFGRKRSRKA
ncbi:PEP-CTERM sorting domain-containing protein [Geobacter argillaceus]|uniref:Putative secreted protein with PEP-CTERM sorting signal n=1 Tax=Geobacter argillaceus TaxID=345631 RepID=A0A562VHI9_9BACT|nr:PEP-CTERM sorting domain-containing protein [Geobacter argillaceus]TWJ17332.1 putative secreted protein with PEP-CTERM sorting signal [Geobacter argillaceus]